MKEPLVSVIVTTHNSARTLKKCLASVKEQIYKSVEIVVVDNKSTDNTGNIAKKYTKNVLSAGNERSEQRNIGAEKARGEYLFFLDSDMYLTKYVIGQCVELTKKTGCVGIYIPEKIKGKGFFAKIRNFERSFYNGTVIDAIRFISKSNFIASKSFDEKLSAGEDWDFDKRVRGLGKTGIIRSPLYHDEGRMNFISYLTKKNKYARPLNRYIRKWGKDDPDIRKQLGLYYRYLGVFIENGKWKKTLGNPLLFISVICIKTIQGVMFLINRIKT